MALTNNQLFWAKQHDWFVRFTKDGGVVVADWSCDCHGNRVPFYRTFYNLAQLRAWAGY